MLPSTASSTFPASPIHGCRRTKGSQASSTASSTVMGRTKGSKNKAKVTTLTYGKPKETPDPFPYPCEGGTFFLLPGQGMDPKEMTTCCHATRCHTLGVITWPSNRKKFGPTTRCLDLSCLVLCLVLLPLPPPFLSFFISYLSAFYLF